MIDNIKLISVLENPPEQIYDRTESTFEWKGLRWCPYYNKEICEVSSYKAKLNNLDLKITGDYIECTNSLQKWYMGNNYEPFTHEQVCKAIHSLNKQLPFDVFKAKIIKFEFGANIEHEASTILNTWLHIRNKEPSKMLNRGKFYGLKFFSHDYTIKGYDKTFEVKKHDDITLNNNLFRFEVTAYTRHLNNRKHPIRIYTMNDLLDEEKYLKLANELVLKYNMIEKYTSVPLDKLDNKQKEILALFQNTQIVAQYKNDHIESYRKKKIGYNKLKKLSNQTFITTIKDQIYQSAIGSFSQLVV